MVTRFLDAIDDCCPFTIPFGEIIGGAELIAGYTSGNVAYHAKECHQWTVQIWSVDGQFIIYTHYGSGTDLEVLDFDFRRYVLGDTLSRGAECFLEDSLQFIDHDDFDFYIFVFGLDYKVDDSFVISYFKQSPSIPDKKRRKRFMGYMGQIFDEN